jgi:RHS repeat-associated protein
MPGRSFTSSNSYKYGFNGKENDNEVVGTGSGTQDYGARIYNPALGRFLSTDPLGGNFPWNSPYAFAENRPIDGIDLDGKEWAKTSNYDPKTGITTVALKLTIKVVNSTCTETQSQNIQDLMVVSQGEFATTFTQFDKDTKTQYTAKLEYEFVDKGQVGPSDFYVELVDGPIQITENGVTKDYLGYTLGGSGNTQSNYVQVGITNGGFDRLAENFFGVVRTLLHELGHTGGLEHPELNTDVIETPNLMVTDQTYQDLNKMIDESKDAETKKLRVDVNNAKNINNEQIKTIDCEVSEDTCD